MNIDIKNTDTLNYIEEVRAINRGKERFAHVITFGCQQNEADSEKLRAMAEMMGYKLSDKYGNADIIIMNTCAIREHAEMKALSMLGKFKERKKENPELVIGVCGCMASEGHRADMLKNDFHYVSFTLEPSMIHRMPELVYNSLMLHKRSFVYGTDTGDIIEGIGKVRASRHSAYVSVMYGCNNFCTYCIVPYARGRERSRRSADVIDECRELVMKGYKEITLLGQNVNSYRSDITFPELLKRVCEIEGDFIIRFMTSHPKDVSDELIEVMAESKGKIAPSFHLPLQSGSDSVLKRMNRTYTAEKYLDTVQRLRSAIPDIGLTSDIIVGFPGESDEDYRQTVDLLRDVKFDMVYAFSYSKRAGTKAEKLDGHIPESIKKARLEVLISVQADISLQKNRALVGECVRVLVDSHSKRGGEHMYSARTPQNKLVHFESERELVGQLVNVKITSAGDYELYAELIEN